MSTSHGIVIRIPIDDIRQIGRATEGVRLIKLEDGDEVRAIERVQKQDKARKPKAARTPSDAFASDGNAQTAAAADDEEELLEDEDGDDEE